MKKIDRFLLAIIVGVVLLVIVALALALTRQPQGYMDETTPGSIAYNYIYALKQHDYERAYGYLAPDLKGYPPSLDDFVADINLYRWQFEDTDRSSMTIEDERINGDRAVITLTETRFYQSGPFGNRPYSQSFELTLRQSEATWKLTTGESYWVHCWNDGRPCK